MRIALCFHGLVGSHSKGGVGKQLLLNDSFNSIKKNLIKSNPNIKFDIFVHSQSKEKEKEIIKILKPISFKIENQLDFPSSKIHPEIKKFYKYLSFYKNIYKFNKYIELKKIQSFQAHSRWYSANQVSILKKKYEKLNNFKYNYVVLLRLDFKFLRKIDLNKLNKKKIYCSNWNNGPTPNNNYSEKITLNNLSSQKKYGVLDFWFIGDSKIMDIFSSLYNEINNYKIDPHTAAKEHILKNKLDIEFFLYRFIDFELTRRLYKSKI